MTIILKKNSTVEDLKHRMLHSKSKRKKKLFSKFCGTVRWNEDGVKYQKRLRREWN